MNELLIEKFQQWVEASQSYYAIDGNESILSDEQFDALTIELTNALPPDSHEYAVVTKSITSNGEQRIEHEHNDMVSLYKIQIEKGSDIMEISRWFKDKLNDCYVGTKLDGHAVKLQYNNDKSLMLATTRGGMDITQYLRNHADVKEISNLVDNGFNQVACEMVLPKQTFLNNWSYDALGEKNGYSNARNAVGGVLKKDANDLRIVALTDGVNPLTAIPHKCSVNWVKLTSIGGINGLQQFYDKTKTIDYPYLVDGLVIGYHTDKRVIKNNYPLNMVSIKYPAPTAKTKVIGMSWSQKKSGVLTPTYDLQPVQLDGIIVKSANAYNYDNMVKLHCGIGSEVVIVKSNEIMPIVQKVITRSKDIQMPDVEYKHIGKHLVATNMDVSYEYRFILGIKVLGIHGIGDTIADQYGKLINHDIVEIFNKNHKPKLLQEFGMSKNFEKVCSIYDTSTLPLDVLIEMLQFSGCGKVLSRKFALMMTADKTSPDYISYMKELTTGVDKNVLHNVCKGEGMQRIQEAMKRLLTYGVKVIKPVEINDETVTYEMSGTPPNMSKDDFKKVMKQKYPNSAHTSLVKGTTYLIVDSLSSTTSKMNKARKNGTKIITYQSIIDK